jgi:hypothetical protein
MSVGGSGTDVVSTGPEQDGPEPDSSGQDGSRQDGSGPAASADSDQAASKATGRFGPGTPLTRSVPWLFPVLVALIGLISLHVPAEPIAKYAAYFALAEVLPGILILRALWRSTGNWAEDVGLGAVVGITFQLVGWAIFTALGWQSWLVIWPALVIVAFAAVPSLRRHWRIADPKPLPLLWNWGMAFCIGVLLGGAAFGVMAFHPMPPNGIAYYPDLLYHLSMVNELTRSVPPQLPQAVGQKLDYHWFANADMAGAVDITKLSPIIVLYRLWLLPMLAVALLVFATLARTVSRTWWTGVLAAAPFAGSQAALWWDRGVDLTPPLSLLSPSQTFGMIAGAAAAVFLIQLLFRGDRHKGLWVLALSVSIVGGGSKPTILPILVGAVGLAALYLLIRDRKLPARFLAAGLLLVASTIGTMATVAGSTSGSGLQLLAILKVQAGYRAATLDTTPAAKGGFILPALTSGRMLSLLGVIVIFALLMIGQLTAAVGYGMLGQRQLRREPLAWFLLGALIAGWAAFLVVDHPSVSEAYFVRSTVPFSIAAAGWLAVILAKKRRPSFLLVPAAVVLGSLYAFLLLWAIGKATGSQFSRILMFARPLIVVLAVTVVLVIVWRFATRQWPRLVGLGGVLVLLTIIAVPVASGVARNLYIGSHARSQVFTSRVWQVYPDEAGAALWLAGNSRSTDVVASNTWCRPAGPQRPGCDTRGYIVTGIAGRRAVIEGWAYTQQALANHGVGGKRYTQQPSPWPDRVAITEQAMYAPTPAVLKRLHSQYAVRWLFADLRDGRVSPRLGQLAALRHSQGQIRIYELTR